MGPLALLIGSGFFLNRDVDPFYEDQFFFFLIPRRPWVPCPVLIARGLST